MAAPVAVVGGQLIDGTGAEPLADALVLIEEGSISYAGPKSGKRLPKNAEIVEADGASVLPGLMDVHVHISMCAPNDLVQEVIARPLGEAAFEVSRNLVDTVAAGVTTIRTVGDLAHLDIAARNAINAGRLIGPRVHPCGMGLTATGGHGQILPCWLKQDHGEICDVVDGPDAVRAGIRRQARAGATWIKLFQTGGVVDPHGRLDAEEFSPDEFSVAMETANMMALPVAVHAHNKKAILRCIEAGVNSVEHGMHFDEECAEKARASGTFLVPTLTVMDRILVYGAQVGLAEFMIENVRERTSKHHEYVKHAHSIGANIASGTDAGSLLTPHGSAGREVVQLVKCGLSVIEAIQVATQNTAKLLKVDGETGSLASGKLGDLIVVEGDVMKDPSNLETAGNMRRVLIGGRTVAAGGKALPH